MKIAVICLFCLAILIFTACEAASVQLPSMAYDNIIQNTLTALYTSGADIVTYTMISPIEAKEMMNTETCVVLDVRRLDEFITGHIKGAICLDNDDISTENPDVLPYYNTNILIYCRTGRRSKESAQKLINMGYTNVYEFGGIFDWPYEIVTE